MFYSIWSSAFKMLIFITIASHWASIAYWPWPIVYYDLTLFWVSKIYIRFSFIWIWFWAVGSEKPHGHKWNPVVRDKDASKATFIVYGEGKNIDAGINRLEHLLEGDFDTKEFKDEIIKKLSKTQVCYQLRVLYKCWMALRTMYVRIS